MSLQEKVLRLKLDALLAARHADHWQKLINEHGEAKATRFYTSLGLNHLQKKGYDWEGLSLSREPKEHEKLCIKGVANAQESAKEQIGTVLTALRSKLITQGVESIEKLSPKDYHTLVLEVPQGAKTELRSQLDQVYKRGRRLVAQELGTSKQEEDEDEEDRDEELDDLTDLTNGRVVNDVQSRIIAAAGRFALLGLTAIALINAVQKELADGSVSYIDRSSTGLANVVINMGRSDEARFRRSEWERVEYSAILDQNVCGPCAAEDGQEATDESELTPVPNPECEGGDWCRCFHVYVAEGNM